MKFLVLSLSCLTFLPLGAETIQQRGKRVVDECLEALGGERFLNMQNREMHGRAYSFYREQLSGLAIATIYTRYESGVKDTAHELAIRERQNFGKKQDYGVLFLEKAAYEITFRGARPIPDDRWERYKETTLRDIFYIQRFRRGEPLIYESRGADVLDNAPVEIVDITDADNRVTTVYFHKTTKLPVRQVFQRRNAVTKDMDEEVTLFTTYRELSNGVQWPFTIERMRNGEKIFQMFADSATADSAKLKEDLFELPANIKMLKPE